MSVENTDTERNMGASHGKTEQQSKGVYKTVFFLVVGITVILALFLNRFLGPQLVSDEQLKVLGARVFDKPRIFEQQPLIDQAGQRFDYKRMQGKWSMVFFGFTFCPDVCPTTLALLSKVHKGLPAELGESTQVILVSVDPARDTPAKLAEYLEYFSPDFTGLTGAFLDLQRFARQLNIAFQKVPGGGENYSIDHSAQIVLINPRGDYHAFLQPPFSEETLSKAFQSVVNNYQIRYD